MTQSKGRKPPRAAVVMSGLPVGIAPVSSLDEIVLLRLHQVRYGVDPCPTAWHGTLPASCCCSPAWGRAPPAVQR